eukprot:jgi/Botrbrau1/15888/Bobra.40_1s0071.1
MASFPRDPGQLLAAEYAFGWTSAFVLIRYGLLPHHSADFSNRFVSLLHALVTVPLAIAAMRSPVFASFGQRTSDSELRVLTMSLGYFVYDTICCSLIDFDLPSFIHHLCTILGLSVGVCLRKSGGELTACLLLMEMSNPFLHLRYMLKESRMESSSFAVLNDMAFAVSFIICRVLIGPLVVYHTLTCSSSSTFVKVGGLGVQLVSLFWFYKVAQTLRRKFKQRLKGA